MQERRGGESERGQVKGRGVIEKEGEKVHRHEA